ncbi:HypC/HybG/HupF family hydrogenase formation chaperone [Micromonospora sp. NPDC004551]|uniref:HypC/HybG/HupF family hydrogenase formation chaperone n=1 Tax=Micromonospora sp. NPDC004551 TaxID=3154284 RepID=UPI0033AC6D65
MSPRPAPATRAVPECHDDVCITCSDAAVAVRVRELRAGGLAVVDTDAGPEEVSVALVEAEPGDVVLVHAKEAIAVVEKRS